MPLGLLSVKYTNNICKNMGLSCLTKRAINGSGWQSCITTSLNMSIKMTSLMQSAVYSQKQHPTSRYAT